MGIFIEFIKLSVQTFQLIYKRRNFVYYHWGCISIYLSMSFPCTTRNIFVLLLYTTNKIYIRITNIKRNYKSGLYVIDVKRDFFPNLS